MRSFSRGSRAALHRGLESLAAKHPHIHGRSASFFLFGNGFHYSFFLSFSPEWWELFSLFVFVFLSNHGRRDPIDSTALL